MKARSSKMDKPYEPDEFLDDIRKKISKAVRKRITGGDMLTIDDF